MDIKKYMRMLLAAFHAPDDITWGEPEEAGRREQPVQEASAAPPKPKDKGREKDRFKQLVTWIEANINQFERKMEEIHKKHLPD